MNEYVDLKTAEQKLAELFTLSQNLESIAIETGLPKVWDAQRFVDRSIEAIHAADHILKAGHK